MEKTTLNGFNNSWKDCGNNRTKLLSYIKKRVEKGTGISLIELKMRHSEERLFYESLKHVTTTNKTICEALKIPVEAGCRYKRKLEKSFLLVQSNDEFRCPFTKHKAHVLTTNPKEFTQLRISKFKQLELFKDSDL